MQQLDLFNHRVKYKQVNLSCLAKAIGISQQKIPIFNDYENSTIGNQKIEWLSGKNKLYFFKADIYRNKEDDYRNEYKEQIEEYCNVVNKCLIAIRQFESQFNYGEYFEELLLRLIKYHLIENNLNVIPATTSYTLDFVFNLDFIIQSKKSLILEAMLRQRFDIAIAAGGLEADFFTPVNYWQNYVKELKDEKTKLEFLKEQKKKNQVLRDIFPFIEDFSQLNEKELKTLDCFNEQHLSPELNKTDQPFFTSFTFYDAEDEQKLSAIQKYYRFNSAECEEILINSKKLIKNHKDICEFLNITENLLKKLESLFLDNCFSILNISGNPNKEEIKIAFRKKSMEYHPDQGGTHEEFLKLQSAYQEALRLIES